MRGFAGRQYFFIDGIACLSYTLPEMKFMFLEGVYYENHILHRYKAYTF